MEYNSGSDRASNFKLAEREFEITSPITPWVVRHELQLVINRNYNKIREEYDSGITSSMTHTTVQLQAHDVCNCTITAEIRPADDQSDSRILIYR